MRQFIKIPIILFDSKQANVGIENPDTIDDAPFYADPNEIIGFRVAHDERLGDPLNGEATTFYLRSGESFSTYMHISEFIELIKHYITCQ